MAQEYKCRLCTDVIYGDGSINNARYTCPRHKFICGDHVKAGWLGGNPKCEVCGKTVIRYIYSRRSGKWEKG